MVYKLAVLGAGDITLHLDQEVSSLHRGDAVVGVRELFAGEVGVIPEDQGNEALLPCETFWDVGDLESTPREHVPLVDEEEVSLDLVPSELHLLSLEVALASSGEVGHEAIVVQVDGGAPEGLKGSSPTFDESLDPEGERLGYLGKYKVGGRVDVDGVGHLVHAFAGEALCLRVVSRIKSDPLGGEIHPVTHRDVKARDFTFVFDISLGHVGGFVVVIANKLLQA
jgi:hypothetical protein